MIIIRIIRTIINIIRFLLNILCVVRSIAQVRHLEKTLADEMEDIPYITY